MSKIIRSIGTALLCTFFATEALHAATGDWDHSYGQDGRVSLAIPGVPFSVRSWEIQPDGKTVIAGHPVSGLNELPGYLVARLNADGTPDASFDGDGVRHLSFNSSGDDPIEIELQPDGKIIVAVTVLTASDRYSQLLRLNPNGSLDASFGASGELDLNVASHAGDPRLALAADGSMFVVSARDDSTAATSVVTRVNANGTIDASYGTNGSVVIDSPEDFLQSEQITAMPNGAVALGGRVKVGNDTVPFVALVTPQGQRDASFGNNGVVAIPLLQGSGRINDITASPDGKIVVVGERSDLVGIRHFIARLNSNGMLDATFGSSGRIIVTGRLLAVAVEGDGKIVVAGTVNELATGIALLARYNSDGSPDLTFGSRGRSRADFSRGDFATRAEVRDFDKNADGSYSAFVGFTAGVNPSLNATARFLAGGPSAGAIGLGYPTDGPNGVPMSEVVPNSLEVNVYRTGGADGVSTVHYRVVGLSATAGADFVASSGTITFNDGDIGPKPIALQIIDDNIREGDEHFLVELFGPTGAVLSRERLMIRIGSDQDAGSNVAFVHSSEQVVEGAGAVTLLARRTGDLSTPLTVTYTPTAGTASAGVDFHAAAGTISWAANEGGVRAFSVPVIADADAENSEQFDVSLSVPGSGYPHGTAAVTIIDDDDAASQPRLGFAVSSIIVSEGAANATLQVVRMGDLSQAVSALWHISSGTANAGEDYIDANGTLNWAAGDATPQPITVSLLNDSTREPLEQILVRLLAVSPASEFNGGSAAIWIDDDEPAPPVTVNLGTGGSIAEGTGTLQVPVIVTSAADVSFSVSYAVQAVTATGGDITLPGGTLSWAAGDASSRTISIVINNDTLDEIDEVFSVRLYPMLGDAVVGTASATFTIVDDDPTLPGQPQPVAPGVRFTPASVVVGESEQTVRFDLTRVGDTSGALTAACAVSGGTASIPTDFVSVVAPMYWNASDLSTKSIEYHINGDAIAEPDETIVVRCSASWGVLQLPSNETTITIVDDDGTDTPLSRVSWSSPTDSVDESATSVTLQAVRSVDFSRASSIDYYVTAGTASAADVVIASGTLTWAADDTTAKSVTLSLLPDTIDEPDETFTVTLHNASSGTVLVPQNDVATITVRDDDAPSAQGGGNSNGGGKRGGGGAEHPLALLVYACLALLWARRRQRARCLRIAAPCDPTGVRARVLVRAAESR